MGTERFALAGLVAIALSCGLPATCFAQAIPAVALTGVIASKLIGNFEGSANRILQNAGQQGDVMATKFGDELRVATANLSLALGDQREAFFDNLQPPLRESFDRLNSIIEAVNNIGSKAVSVEESANINLIEFTNRLPFTDKVDFYISSIQGLTQIWRPSDYKIYLNGLGLGLSNSSVKYNLSILIDGKPVPSSAFQQTSSHETWITIPHTFIEPMFQDASTSTKKVDLQLEVEKVSTELLFFHSTSKASYKIELAMVLLPRFPGQISGTQPLKALELGQKIFTTSVQNTVSSCNRDHPCDWSRTVDLAQDEFAVGVRYSCAGQCPFDYALRHGGSAPDFDILQEGHKVTVYRHNDGDAGSTTGTYYIDYKKQVEAFHDGLLGPQKIQFEQPLTIDLDPKNVDCAYALTASLVTKQSPYIDSGMSESADQILNRISTSKMGDHCRVVLNIHAP